MDENYKKPNASSSNVVQPMHDNLLELVQKNKTIAAVLNNLTANDPRLCCLKKAIVEEIFGQKFGIIAIVIYILFISFKSK